MQMKKLVENFVTSLQDEEENLTFSNLEQLKEVQNIIYGKMETLIDVIHDNDKENWFKEICLDNPN